MKKIMTLMKRMTIDNLLEDDDTFLREINCWNIKILTYDSMDVIHLMYHDIM